MNPSHLKSFPQEPSPANGGSKPNDPFSPEPATPPRLLHRKSPEANLRLRYGLHVEIGSVLALVTLIALIRAPLTGQNDGFNINMSEQEVVQIEQIKQTTQIEKPPPPPRPPVPVEVPNDEVLEDVDLDLDASLDLDAVISDLPPPPPSPAMETEEEKEEPEIFVIVEQMPQLIGGLPALQKLVKYPEMAKKAGVSGRVILQFVVDENGNVLDPVVVRGIGGGCDEEALRAIQRAKFKPGLQRGKPVRVRFSLPIVYRLR